MLTLVKALPLYGSELWPGVHTPPASSQALYAQLSGCVQGLLGYNFLRIQSPG